MSTDVINLDLQRTLRLIPGYDPFAQAGDCWFDDEAAQDAIDFVEECCTHVKAGIYENLAGKPFLLELWQKAIFGNLFGWKQQNGSRRYREALIFVPRKNGKTLLGAALVCTVLFTDNEPPAF